MADAAVAVPAVDAAVPGGIDPALLARIPEAGILLSILTDGGFSIARLDRKDVANLSQHEVGTGKLGWLDDKTIVVLDTAPPGDDDGAVTVSTVTAEGKSTRVARLDDAWESADLWLTRTGEAWVARCTKEPDGPDDCERFEYLRVIPGPRKKTTRKPKGIEAYRTAHRYAADVRVPFPEVKPPKGITVKKVPFEALSMTGTSKLTGIECKAGAAAVRFPDVKEFDTAYGYDAREIRWVLERPPIFEVTADLRTPVDTIDPQVDYFRPCEPTPLPGFVALGNGIWAELTTAKPDDDVGTWTFRIEDQVIGTLPGLAIMRANR